MYEIFEKELERQGLTVAEISRITGISKSTLSDTKTTLIVRETKGKSND